MSWYKESLRLRTLEEAQEDYAEVNMDEIDYLVRVLSEHKRLVQLAERLKPKAQKSLIDPEKYFDIFKELQDINDVWDRYSPELQFFALNKFKSQYIEPQDYNSQDFE